MSKCVLCELRKPRRRCPGVNGDICPQCCGEKREVTVNCPLDCEYLQEARLREPLAPVDPDKFPNKDITVSDRFLRDHENLLLAAGSAVYRAAMEISGAVDSDVREALDGLVRTYRTMQSGLIYDSLPTNPLAASIYRRFREAMEQFAQTTTQETGMAQLRDADVLGILVFLQRLSIDRDNGRPKGRAFVDLLRLHFENRNKETSLIA